MDPRLLLLLTSTLLSCYFQPGRGVGAEQNVVISQITVTIEPSSTVTRDTNVTLRCKATVSITDQIREQLTFEYRLYKNNKTIFNKTSRTSEEDLVHHLPEVRVSDSGNYHCSITIKDQVGQSEEEKLKVNGLSKPVLHLSKDRELNEGEEITATCTAPGEKGSLVFFFHGSGKEKTVNSHSNQAQIKLNFRTGSHDVHCTYKVFILHDAVQSEESNHISISVRELPVRAELTIVPQDNVYEGDQLNISCSMSSSLHRAVDASFSLRQGSLLFGVRNTAIRRTIVAQTTITEEFECKVKIGLTEKVDTKTLLVNELFSRPTLTISPEEVFQNESMTLTCRSEHYARERLHKDELVYSLHPSTPLLSLGTNGVFRVRALSDLSSYSCGAQAQGVSKYSDSVTVRPKVAVSRPKISVHGQAILGELIWISCHSERGSLPINYTLLKDSVRLGTKSSSPARFTVNITKSEELKRFRCAARNSNRGDEYTSENLNTTVIVPPIKPVLTILPPPPDIYEGITLYIICGSSGTHPITFTLYRGEQRLNSTTLYGNHINFQIPALTKQHSGTYICKVENHAKKNIASDPAQIQVSMARWKKAMIGGFSLLALVVLVLASVLYFRSRRAKVHKAEISVWSKRPPEADEMNDEESSVVTNEPDVEYTEVVHPQPVDPARVPLRKGTDTVYSELRDGPHGAADHHDYGSVEYAELNGEQPEINHYHPEVNAIPDLPVPVD